MGDPLSAIASIAGLIQITAVVASSAYGYFSTMKGASKEMEGLWNELKALEKVLRDLQTSFTYVKSGIPSALDGPFQACYTEMKELQVKLMPKKRKINWIHRVKWPLEQKEVMTVILRIERHKSLFALALTTDQHCLLRAVEVFSKNTYMAVGDLMKSLEEEFLALKRHMRQEAQSCAGEKRMKVLNWLYLDEVNRRHNEISGRRQKHTGKWLLRHPQFQTWVKGETDARMLYGYGIPGAGKTFLTSLVINELEALTAMKGFGLAYIYFNFKEQEQQTPANVLSSLIRQLVSQAQDLKLPQDLEDLYNEHYPENKRPTVDELKMVLLSITPNLFPRVFFVFDALDESDEKTQRKQLLPFFQDLVKSGASLFTTSRPYPRDIKESLKGDSVRGIELAAKEEDIRIYVEEAINGSSHAKALIQGTLRDKLISKLVECCNGMFLVVHFHIEDLCQYTSIKQVGIALEELAASLRTDQPLNGIYNRAMENIKSQHPSRVRLANRVLLWLVKSKRVLTVDELRMIVSVEQGDTRLPSEVDMPDATMLVEVCAGLVIIDEMSNTVRVAHYSVQEYLMGNSLLPQTADFDVVVFCLTILSFDFDKPPRLRFSYRQPTSHSMLQYVALHFGTYLKMCNEDSTTEIFLKFLKHEPALNLYQLARDSLYKERMRRIIHEDIVGNAPLLEASGLGHLASVSILLEEGSVISVKGFEGQTALHMAASEGHSHVVQLLLEKGADIEAMDSRMWRPLHAAVSRQQESTVRILLEKGALTLFKDVFGFTCLKIANIQGSKSIARLLIQAAASTSDQEMRRDLPPLPAMNHDIKERLVLSETDPNILAIDNHAKSRRALIHLLKNKTKLVTVQSDHRHCEPSISSKIV